MRSFKQLAANVPQGPTSFGWARHQVGGAQVTVGFSSALAKSGAAAQAQLLEQVVAALDRVPDVRVAGVNIMLGSEYGVDDGGNIWLHASGTTQDWMR